MKKIYAQKRAFIFVNIFSLFLFIIGIYGGFIKDSSVFYSLFVSLGLFLLSLLFLINRIYYNDKEIKFKFIYRKISLTYEDIKEIFIQTDFIYGTKVIFNFEKETDEICFDYLEYTKILKKNNIKNTIFMIGTSKKELDKILLHCNCKLKGEY